MVHHSSVLDSLVNIAPKKKNENGRIPLQIVTACVDDIRFHESFHNHSASDDLFVKGQVAWVGRSSMDCFCSIENRNGDVLVESRFIMVARCPATGS